MMISFTPLQVKFLLFGTNSIFHNDGLSIYGITTEIDSHSISFIKNDFEKISLTKLEDRILNSDDDLEEKINILKNDAIVTAKKIIKSAGRQGILFSSNILEKQMNPHIHRQAYSVNPSPCLTIHYNLCGENKSVFRCFDPIDQQTIIKENLCDRKSILKWCKNKKFNDVILPKNKNVILFNSWAMPHCVLHSSDFNIFFIFDHVKLIDERYNKSDFAIIQHE